MKSASPSTPAGADDPLIMRGTPRLSPVERPSGTKTNPERNIR